MRIGLRAFYSCGFIIVHDFVVKSDNLNCHPSVLEMAMNSPAPTHLLDPAAPTRVTKTQDQTHSHCCLSNESPTTSSNNTFFIQRHFQVNIRHQRILKRRVTSNTGFWGKLKWITSTLFRTKPVVSEAVFLSCLISYLTKFPPILNS